MNANKVLISILNWNKAAETLACLKSLEPELENLVAEVSVLIIDNGSNNQDLAKLEAGIHLKSYSLKKLPKNLGFTGGHNFSIQISIDEGFDFIWLLNNDSIVQPGALSALLSTMQAEPKCGAASPVIHNADDEYLIATCVRTHSWQSRSYTQVIAVEEAARIQSEHPESVWLVGTAIFFRVQALKQVGLLDDRFFAYYDDNDIGVRLSSGGWHNRCVFSASVAHEVKRTTGQYPLYFYYLMQRNEMLFWVKHMPSKYRRLLWLKLVDKALFDVNRLFRDGLQTRGEITLLAVSDFIFQRFGAPELNRTVPIFIRILCKISKIINKKKLIPINA